MMDRCGQGAIPSESHKTVTPGLVRGIDANTPFGAKDVDGRDKPGHDARGDVSVSAGPIIGASQPKSNLEPRTDI
jgi:hypothetical protein